MKALIAVLAVVGIAGCGQQEPPPKNAFAVRPETSIPRPPKPDKTLGMQPTAFVGRINEAFKEITLNAQADQCKVSTGTAKDSMQCAITGRDGGKSGFSIFINHEDQSAREILFVLNNGTETTVLQSFMIMAAAIEAVDSANARKSSGDWLTSLIKKASASKEQSASVVVNGREYTVSLPPGLGLWFVISQPG